ncbi:RHS repeat protein [Bartonella sp. HY329]|uniref:RHS repeat domain-containing protein n=1 Tax=unclassified Bartonella TaxID=2645622 RepID=UPI0021C8AC84|nr:MULTISPECIES: RHS repeat domain-containing protein [unclassified Bartonella]UXM96194.1 RHS repeat protein [Bartonella sp. HY329]UXN10518.1 RHS repeat protein [Bartonella sp. HY328]
MQDETIYHYDQTGLLSRAENNSAVVAFKRDALGRVISETKGPNGERVHLTYDSRNRVIERRVKKNGFRIKIWKYQWDAKDRLIG